jgi:hypothetical protein
MILGALFGCGKGYSTSPLPSELMRPMALAAPSVNQMTPSGAIEIVVGPLAGVGSANPVTVPVTTTLS